MDNKPKYTHSYSLDIHTTSDLEGAEDTATKEEIDAIYKAARLDLKQRVDCDKIPLEWYDTETND